MISLFFRLRLLKLKAYPASKGSFSLVTVPGPLAPTWVCEWPLAGRPRGRPLEEEPGKDLTVQHGSKSRRKWLNAGGRGGQRNSTARRRAALGNRTL